MPIFKRANPLKTVIFKQEIQYYACHMVLLTQYNHDIAKKRIFVL